MATMSYGQLRSWGNLTGTAGTDLIYFSGTSSITGTVKTSWPSGFKPKLVNPLVAAGGTYPIDTAGYSPVPLEGPPQLTYTIILNAPAGYADDVAFNWLRTQWATVYSFIMGTYTLDSVAGTSGQRGWLVQADERTGNSTLYKAKARCLEPAPFELSPGLPHQLTFTLTFGLLSDFVAY
jgi:hypothetical protein